jgi:hypothetical protein
MPKIENEAIDHLQQQDTKPTLKPFAGGLAALKIQPDVKSERKFTSLSISPIYGGIICNSNPAEKVIVENHI